MQTPSSTTGRVVRWLVFPVAVGTVALAGLVGSILLLEAFEDLWLAIPAISLATAAAVYIGSRLAPSRKRLSIALAAAVIVLAVLYLRSLTSDGDREARGLAMAALGGVAIGVFLAVRRTRTTPVQVLRSTEHASRRYKGTAPFQYNSVDRRTFFGRDHEIRSLLSLVLAERLVVVFGKSGTGKSSLINAGLVGPLAERGYLPLTLRLSSADGPVAGVLDGVRAAAQAAGVEIMGGDATDLAAFFRTAEFWSDSYDLLQPVIILDQFEELFTLHGPSRRREFIAQLAEIVRWRSERGRSAAVALPATAAASVSASKLKVVLSLREDFLADLEELAQDIPGILQHRFRIGVLTAENAREAIVGPAALEDAAFEIPPFAYTEGALQRILSFLARRRQKDETMTGDEVEPAQLQLVCQYVEELVRARLPHRRDGTRVEVSEADLGGEARLQRILEEFYDRTLASIDTPSTRRRIQRLCEQRLISRAGRRLTEAEEEIEKKYGVPPDILRQLVDARLLRPEPRLGAVFYELSHDTLVEPIQRSRKKRIARQRRGWVTAAALVMAYVAPWWLLTGRENRVRQQALALVVAGLPDRNDPGQVLALPKARLMAIEEQLTNGVRTRDAYAAMMFAAEDVGLRYPELNREVRRLRNSITEQFNREHGVQAVDADEDVLNRRILIEGGTFLMGSPEQLGEPQEHPRHPVMLTSFRIQEHEVTNAEYRRFDPNHDRFAPDDLPVVNVSWYDAAGYAAWIGGSLPTEAQWEFVARGKGGRTYPWGEEDPTCARANFQACGSAVRPVRDGRAQGQTPDRVFDLAGNVWEWCRDWSSEYLSDERTDPLGPPSGSMRVVRGGSFFNTPYDLRGVNRYSSAPDVSNVALGFRVVWSAGEGPD